MENKLKIQIMSDLHLEFLDELKIPEVDSDLVVLAGDIHVGEKAISWIKNEFLDKTVIYVLGNHEYYGKTYPKLIEKLKFLTKDSNIYVLEKDKLVIDGVIFLACTLWTDFNLFGNPRITGYEISQKMNDYKKIKISPKYRKIKSVDIASVHDNSLRWLKSELDKVKKNEKIVVISHHGPSVKSLYKNNEDVLNAAYVSNLDSFIEASNIKLWIHGHVHKSNDYFIGKTRVVSNPRGYVDDLNNAFVDDLLILL